MLKLKLQFHAAPGSTNALRNATFDKLQLNAGMFIKNFDYSEIDDATELKTAIAAAIAAGTDLLGATRGGGTFSVSREMRNPEIDGMRYRFKGGNFVDSTDPYLSTTLVECTPENFALALGATATTSGKKTTVKMNTAIEPDEYLTNLCWVGDLADGQLVMIVLYNALNTADFTFTFVDKGEGTLAVEFHACQDEVNDYDEAPFEVIFFDTDGTLGEMTITSAAGTNVGGTKITSDHALASGEHFVYKTGNIAPSIGYHEPPDYTWTEWDGTSDIDVGTANNGKKITVALLNSSGKVISSGNATLVVKTA